jgi:hypothetical protein
MIVPMIVWLLVWDFGPQPVVKAELSPDGAYAAEVVLSDRGIYGRSVYVNVTPQDQDIKILVGKLGKKPRQVYKDAYDMFEDIVVEWEPNNILCVNGSLLPID